MHKGLEYIVGLGTNQGNRQLNLEQAFLFLNTSPFTLIKRSGLYETSPWGFESDNQFLNACVVVQTELDPLPFLERLKQFEKKAGRVERLKDRYTDRIIDLDILACGDLVFNHVSLVIPHPQLHKRAFAMEPLGEICPEWVHPVFEKTVRELLNALPNPKNEQAPLKDNK